jgi:hypothetical protein
MGKGIAVETVAYLVIAAVIIIFLVPILIRSAGAVWDKILQGLGITKPTALEKAVECSYYRCIEGCLSYKVTDEIEWEDNGRTVKCNEFCNVPKEFRGTNDEICGWNALQYPVEIKVENDTEVGKKIDDINFDCITTDDSSWGFGSGAKDRTFIFINKNLLKNIKREKCEYPGVAGFLGFGIYNAIEKAQISANNNAFIHTYYGGPPIQGISGLVWGGTTTTQVDNKPAYIIISEKEKPYKVQVSQDAGPYRISITALTPSLEYKFKITNIGDYPTPFVSLNVSNATYWEEKTVTKTSSFYFMISNGAIRIELDDVSGSMANLTLTYTSALPIPTSEYLPHDQDAWTEYQSYIDNYCWIAYNAQRSSDRKVGSYSFYGENAPVTIGLKFYFWCALGGEPLAIDSYDKLHFWFKSPVDATYSNIYFDAEDGVPFEMVCSIENYRASYGWKEYVIDLKNDCLWLTEKKPIISIHFDFENRAGGTIGYIDGLYLCKNC